MALTATEIGSIVQELAPALTGGWIQKITQPLPDVLLLEIRVPGHTRRLLCSVHEETARLHLIRQTLSNPPTPPSFCQLLRARVQGARIDGSVRSQTTGSFVWISPVVTGRSPWSPNCSGRNADLLFLDGEQCVLATIRHNKERSRSALSGPFAHSVTSRCLMIPSICSPKPRSIPSPSHSPPNWNYCTVSAKSELSHQTQLRARESVLRKTLKKHLRRMAGLSLDLEQATQIRTLCALWRIAESQSRLIEERAHDRHCGGLLRRDTP